MILNRATSNWTASNTIVFVLQVDYVHPLMLAKARVLAAPPASHPPRLHHGMFKVVFRNKFMYVCNCYDEENVFDCAYVYREKSKGVRPPPAIASDDVYKVPLSLDAIRLYEELSRSSFAAVGPATKDATDTGHCETRVRAPVCNHDGELAIMNM